MAIGLVVMASLIGMVVLFVYLATVMENVAMKILFSIMSMLSLVISLNASSVIAVDNGASSNLVNLLNTSYAVGIWIFLIATVILILMTVVHYVSEHKERLEREEDE